MGFSRHVQFAPEMLRLSEADCQEAAGYFSTQRGLHSDPKPRHVYFTHTHTHTKEKTNKQTNNGTRRLLMITLPNNVFPLFFFFFLILVVLEVFKEQHLPGPRDKWT